MIFHRTAEKRVMLNRIVYKNDTREALVVGIIVKLSLHIILQNEIHITFF